MVNAQVRFFVAASIPTMCIRGNAHGQSTDSLMHHQGLDKMASCPCSWEELEGYLGDEAAPVREFRKLKWEMMQLKKAVGECEEFGLSERRVCSTSEGVQGTEEGEGARACRAGRCSGSMAEIECMGWGNGLGCMWGKILDSISYLTSMGEEEQKAEGRKVV